MSNVLSLFTLDVLDKIFNEKKITFKSKTLYLNCFFYWFKKMKLEDRNLSSFYLFLSEIKNFDKWEANFIELENQGVVSIKKDKVVFIDVWSQHLNSELIAFLTKQKCGLDLFYEQMVSNKEMIKLITYKTRIDEKSILEKMELFYFEQKALNTTYKDEQEFKRHFYNWVNHQTYSENQQPKQEPSSIKILGLNNGKEAN
jgi:hypothetical protein